MAHDSDPRLLALHAVRIKGFADDATVARRFGLDRAEVTEHLLDFEAYGFVRRSEFLDLSGWGVTDRGRTANEAQLRDELEETGADRRSARRTTASSPTTNDCSGRAPAGSCARSPGTRMP